MSCALNAGHWTILTIVAMCFLALVTLDFLQRNNLPWRKRILYVWNGFAAPMLRSAFIGLVVLAVAFTGSLIALYAMGFVEISL